MELELLISGEYQEICDKIKEMPVSEYIYAIEIKHRRVKVGRSKNIHQRLFAHNFNSFCLPRAKTYRYRVKLFSEWCFI